MNAEKYATEKAEGKDEVFKIYHAFQDGYSEAYDKKFGIPLLLIALGCLILGIFCGIQIGMKY